MVRRHIPQDLNLRVRLLSFQRETMFHTHTISVLVFYKHIVEDPHVITSEAEHGVSRSLPQWVRPENVSHSLVVARPSTDVPSALAYSVLTISVWPAPTRGRAALTSCCVHGLT